MTKSFQLMCMENIVYFYNSMFISFISMNNRNLYTHPPYGIDKNFIVYLVKSLYRAQGKNDKI